MANIFNFIAFQLVWFISIFSAAAESSRYALIATALFIIIQLWLSPWKKTDIKLILLGLIAGMLLDSIWLNTMLMNYADKTFVYLAPCWIGCLWINFMLTLNHSLSWLQHKPALLALLCIVAAPLSYYAGSEAGAVTLNTPFLALALVSISWAIWIPVLMRFANHWREREEAEQHA
ncbi:DUF2878 domain-containing protein [Methylophaga thalassica]|uniref:DUF2878 domain-containing protein n=1 Tax=Methylophaga thalassica TaxID=40223 RepID=UPI002E7AD4FC|nr:DUF2878 domain-containing protein [Methylophaga thalassica]WVI86467.1 DUF2878 domain-containing protein [Methylophaga thalassica]